MIFAQTFSYNLILIPQIVLKLHRLKKKKVKWCTVTLQVFEGEIMKKSLFICHLEFIQLGSNPVMKELKGGICM